MRYFGIFSNSFALSPAISVKSLEYRTDEIELVLCAF